MLHGINQFEAQYTASAAALEALRRQVATQHALREAGIIAGRTSFVARAMKIVRQIMVGHPTIPSQPGIDPEAYRDSLRFQSTGQIAR
jgi:hypothetical protein